MNKNLKRKLGNKPYRKIFVLSTEGTNTEPDYFSIFDDEYVHIKIVQGKSRKSKKSSPDSVLQRMEEHLEGERLRGEKSDQYWLVIDKDAWLDSQIEPLHQWTIKAANRGLALSNPKFEYWLLLHFECARGVSSPGQVLEHLKRYLPQYVKSLERLMLQKLESLIPIALQNAKQKDVPACKDWPKINGTTVYRLIEEILKQKIATN